MKDHLAAAKAVAESLPAMRPGESHMAHVIDAGMLNATIAVAEQLKRLADREPKS